MLLLINGQNLMQTADTRQRSSYPMAGMNLFVFLLNIFNTIYSYFHLVAKFIFVTNWFVLKPKTSYSSHYTPPYSASQPFATCILNIALPTRNGCDKFKGWAILTGCSSVWKVKRQHTAPPLAFAALGCSSWPASPSTSPKEPH